MIHNYYLGKYENSSSMDILLRRSQKVESKSGTEEWLAETLTYPFHLGPYGGRVLAVHVKVRQTGVGGRLFISQGQIGATTQLEMVVEADMSQYLECNYTVYGEQPFTRTTRVRFSKQQNNRKQLKHDEL